MRWKKRIADVQILGRSLWVRREKWKGGGGRRRYLRRKRRGETMKIGNQQEGTLTGETNTILEPISHRFYLLYLGLTPRAPIKLQHPP